jgi:Xaa-Pro dipeptidase
MLIPWDVHLAQLYSAGTSASLFKPPYGDYDRNPLKAIIAAAAKLGVPKGSKIEIPSITPYPVFLDYVGELPDYDILCRKESAGAEIKKMRAIKDESEIAIYREAAGITNKIIDLLENKVRSGKIKTEADAVQLIEIEARKLGCEGTGFETIAAGPSRSFGIHAFPPWTYSPFGGQGVSIIDFGVKLGPYTADVTLTFVRDPNTKQEKLVNLVEKAYKLALSMAHNGTPTRNIAAAVDDLFARSKKQMPHALGHGIGLDAHEFPLIKSKGENDWILEPGMIFTLEPGLYDTLHGGCRLENDILMTETGAEVLTQARIIRL